MTPKKAFSILTIFLFLLIFLIRLIHLSADPPSTLSMSAGPYGDPGGYAYNARNKILFGTWELDKFNPMYHGLIPHFITYLVFLLFGVGIAQVNLIPVFFSCLVLALFALIVKRMLDSKFALVAFSILGLNYLFLMYSRIANRIMPMVFFLMLALYFFQKGVRNRKWYFFAGFSFVLAFITKGVCFYIVVAGILGFLIYQTVNFQKKETLLSFLFFFSGLGFAFLLWYIFIYIPYGAVLDSLITLNKQFLVPPKSITKMLVHFWTRPSILFENMPIISILSSLSFLMLVFRFLCTPRKIRLLEWILIFWFSGSFFYFAIIYQRITRHFIPLIIPMVFLIVLFFNEILEAKKIKKPRMSNFLFSSILYLWLVFPVSKLLKIVLSKLPSFYSNLWVATSLLAALSLLLVFLFFLVFRAWPSHFEVSLSLSFRKVIVSVLIIAIIVLNAQKYFSFAFHPQYKLKQISVDLGNAFDEAAISGLWAPVLCLENRHRAHESYPGYWNHERDFLQKYKITHVIATTFFEGLENNYYWRNFSEEMANSRIIAKYSIWRGSAFLYELQSPAEKALRKGFFEAEIFTQPQGMPRYDAGATENFAVLADRGQKGFLTIAPSKDNIPKGDYRVIFRLKKEKSTQRSSQRLARIDVISVERNRVLGMKNLWAENFILDKKYQEFLLPVVLQEPMHLIFRIYSDGAVRLWADHIRIEKTKDELR